MRKIVVIMLISIGLYANELTNIKIFTEHYPPYNMKTKAGIL